MADAKQKLVIDVVAKNTAALGGVAAGLNGIKASALGAGVAMRALGPLLAVIVTGKVIKDIVTTNSRFEDLRTTLSTVEGSVQGGAAAFDRISKFATKTQFGVEDLTTTFIKLSTSGIEPTDKLLTTFSNAAAVTTDQVGTLSALTDVYTRSLASGQVELQEFDKLQDRGLPVYDILKQKLGVTRNELGKFSKETGNTELILRTLSETIEERYGDATANLLQNTSTKFSNLGIALKNVADRMGNEFSPSFKDGLDQVTDFVVANEDLMASLGTFIGSTIGLVVKGMGKVITLFFKAVGQVRDLYHAVQEFFLNNELNSGIQKTIDLFLEFGGEVLGIVVEGLRKVSNFLRLVIDGIKGVGSALADLLFKEKEQIKLDDKRVQNLRLLHQGYNTVTKDIKKQNKELNDNIKISSTALMKQEELTQAIYEGADAQLTFRDASESFATGFMNAMKEAGDVMSNLEKAGEKAFGSLTDMVTNFVMTGKLDFKSFARSVIADLVRIAAQAAITFAIKAALKALGGPVGGFISGFLADGGPAKAGKAYMVGERGPELFVPNSSGTVVPNESITSSGGETTINFNISTVDAAGFDTLLASRRGLITNLISDAMNRQGRRFA
jgi:tape measure domain-containing protein